MKRALMIAVATLAAPSAFAAEPRSNDQSQPANPVQSAPMQPASSAEPAIGAKSPAAASSAPRKATSPARGAADRLDLDTTVVTGNRELPKVLYIVPWKKADIGDLPAQPFNSLLDEVLTPVDRDVFRREVTYYEAISAPANAPAAAAPVPSK